MYKEEIRLNHRWSLRLIATVGGYLSPPGKKNYKPKNNNKLCFWICDSAACEGLMDWQTDLVKEGKEVGNVHMYILLSDESETSVVGFFDVGVHNNSRIYVNHIYYTK